MVGPVIALIGCGALAVLRPLRGKPQVGVALVSLLMTTACSQPQPAPIPVEIDRAVVFGRDTIEVFDAGGRGPAGMATADDGTLWVSYSELSDDPNLAGWLVEVRTDGTLERHGPLEAFSGDIAVSDDGHVRLANGYGVWRFNGEHLELFPGGRNRGPAVAVAAGPDNTLTAPPALPGEALPVGFLPRSVVRWSGSCRPVPLDR